MSLLPQLGAKGRIAFGPAIARPIRYCNILMRNRSMGEKLGKGLSLDEALEEMSMVAEGVRAARMFMRAKP